jgi:diketogulonate reductase-like aldo/keto reductase
MPTIALGCAFGDWVGATDFAGFLPEQAWRAATQALDAGYRSFDGAHAYGTERIVGTVLGQAFAAGTLQREDVFITSKLAHPPTPPHVNISHLRTWDWAEVPDISQRLRDDLARTLDDLAMGYVDLLLVHWPGPFANTEPAFAREARATVWQTFVDLYEKKTARAIGVSNFTSQHLSHLMADVPGVRPMVNQVEFHPYCRDAQLEAFCAGHGIVLTAYAPFASGAFDMLRDPVLVGTAERLGVTPGQVVLRWHLQSGRTVLPKTSKATRMRENLDLFGFELSADDMTAIDALGEGEARRTCPDPATVV